MENDSCKHDWVYDNSFLATYPAKQRRICRKCKELEIITVGVYQDINEFDKILQSKFQDN